MRKFSAKYEVGPEMSERGSKTSTVSVVSETFGIFSARSKLYPVAISDHGRNMVISLRPGDQTTISGVKAWRLTSPQKNSVCKNPLEKFSPQFFGIKTAYSSLITFQRAKLSTRSITHLCWCNWRTFWSKTPWEGHQGSLILARKCPGSPGTCNPEETDLPGLPVPWSPTLFSGSSPVGLPPIQWTEKKI